MKIRNLHLLVIALVVFGCLNNQPSKIFETSKSYPKELQQLHQNVLSNIFDSPVDLGQVSQLLSEIKEDGSWPDIDYASKQRGAWKPRQHLTNLLEIARAYQSCGNKFYQKKVVSEKIQLALNYWLNNDFVCPKR
ncbi:MAG: hypothetical protein J7L95_00505 [Prolixibacteraceae bacterium]|nr:hypothetical protein [Prolixibacteraceae bacterium]